MKLVVEEKSDFSKGLEDVVAAESAICRIDGKNSKLSYRGYDIHDLAKNSNFEETAYLLLFGELPTKTQREEFLNALNAERDLPPGFLRWLESVPKDATPMAALRTAVSCLSLFDPEADDKSPESNKRKALRLIARTPVIVANLDRIRRGLGFLAPDRGRPAGIASGLLYLLRGKSATPVEERMLDRYFVLLAEHDLNASTFAARITASTLSDIYSAIASAIGALKGDLHGSANSRTMESLVAIGDVKNVGAFVDEALAKKQKLMGFGHRVYKGPDPRADDLREMAKTLAENNPQQARWYAISEKLEKQVWEKKQLNCNVDFYSASVLYTVGIPIDMFTPMFAISRMAGWTAHVLEQYANNRLIRPVSHYAGPGPRSYVPIDRR